ncbi:hypothetical protein J3D46_004990 [Paenarthrobacter sp. A20]|nr:hypothetical protein [Paenarthrobacter sp. A20]
MVVTPKTHWLSVASTLSAFWADGSGPDASDIRQAIGIAGIEYGDIKGTNKRETVANAVQGSSPAHKKAVVTELVDLLVGESYFQQRAPFYEPKTVQKL